MPGKGLKCIGGIAHGERRIVGDGDHHVVVYLRPPIPRFAPTARQPVEVETRAENYVIDRIRSNGEEIEFLRPAHWTSAQALRHALT